MKPLPNAVVVTRHPALVDYLLEIGLIERGTPVLTHATVKDVQHRNVIGVLPLWLAAEANCITIGPLRVQPADRGAELSLERIRQIAGVPRQYIVDELSPLE